MWILWYQNSRPVEASQKMCFFWPIGPLLVQLGPLLLSGWADLNDLNLAHLTTAHQPTHDRI